MSETPQPESSGESKNDSLAGNGKGANPRPKPVKADQSKIKIPEYKKTTLTPEQIARKEKERSRRRRAHKIRQFWNRFAFIMAALVLIGAAFAYMYWEGNEAAEVVVEGETSEPITSLEKALQESDLNKVAKYADSLVDGLMAKPLPDQIRNLKEKRQIGVRLAESSDLETRKTGLKYELDSLILLHTFDLTHSLNDKDVKQQLEEAANKVLNSEFEELWSKANLGISLAHTHDFIIEPNDESFGMMETTFTKAFNAFPDDVAHVDGLFKIAILVRLVQDEELVNRWLKKVGTLFQGSETVEVRTMGERIYDEVALGQIDYQELNDEIINDYRDGKGRLESLVNNIESNELVSVEPIAKAASLVENLRQIGEYDLEAKLLAKLRKASGRFTGEREKEYMAETFDKYDRRVGLEGQGFELTGKSVFGDDLSTMFKGDVVVVLFYSTLNRDSISALGQLRQLEYLKSKNIAFLLVNMDADINSKGNKKVLNQLKLAVMTSRAGAPKLLEQCPVTKVPYVIILDEEHRVKYVNANPERTRSLVEPLLAD